MAASKAAQKAIQEALSAFSGTAAEKQGLESFISSLKHSDLPTGWQDNPAIVDAAAKMYQQGGTESPFFKAWFGNSKVVDEAGNPLPVYHGTGQKIDAFDPSFTGKGNDEQGSGYYFTNNKQVAGGYAQDSKSPDSNIVEAFLSLRSPIDLGHGGGSIRDFKLTPRQSEQIIKKAPNIYDADESPLTNWYDTGGGKFNAGHIKQVSKEYYEPTSLEGDMFDDASGEFRKALADATKKDSVVKPYSQGNIYTAWFPEQIKGVANRGTFDPSDPNILRSIAPWLVGGGVAAGAMASPDDAEASSVAGLQKFFKTLKHSDLPSGWQDNPDIVNEAGRLYKEMGTESPFFKAWGGSPEKMYHGTTKDFSSFDSAKYGENFTGDYGIGHYLSQDPKSASRYAMSPNGEGSAVYPLYHSLENPATFKRSFADGDMWKYVPDAYDKESLTRGIRGKGHDGVYINDGISGNKFAHELVVFDPTQIKSIFNRGTFDPSDPNILRGIGIGAAGLGAGAAAMAPSQSEAALPSLQDRWSQYDALVKAGLLEEEPGLEEPVWSPTDLPVAAVGVPGTIARALAMALDAPATIGADYALGKIGNVGKHINERWLY